jgi:hypothetical protein
VDFLVRLGARISSANLFRTVGTADGNDTSLIGRVADIAITPSGKVAVVDDRFGRLAVYGVDGTFQGHLGQSGPGPGDFSDPTALVVRSADEVSVLDRGNRLQTFQVDARSPSLLRSSMLDIWPRDICAFGDTLFAVAVAKDRFAAMPAPLVSVLSREGKVVRGFGERYRSSNPLVREAMDNASIECDHAHGLLLVAYAFLPDVHAYRSDGSLFWIAELHPFSSIAVVENLERGSVYRGLLPEEVVSAFVLHKTLMIGNALVVQYAKMTITSVRNRLPYASLESFLIDVRTGASYYVGDDLEAIAGLVGDRIVTFVEHPVPVLKIRDLGPG